MNVATTKLRVIQVPLKIRLSRRFNQLPFFPSQSLLTFRSPQTSLTDKSKHYDTTLAYRKLTFEFLLPSERKPSVPCPRVSNFYGIEREATRKISGRLKSSCLDVEQRYYN